VVENFNEAGAAGICALEARSANDADQHHQRREIFPTTELTSVKYMPPVSDFVVSVVSLPGFLKTMRSGSRR
jgi:hypothetical protein